MLRRKEGLNIKTVKQFVKKLITTKSVKEASHQASAVRETPPFDAEFVVPHTSITDLLTYHFVTITNNFSKV